MHRWKFNPRISYSHSHSHTPFLHLRCKYEKWIGGLEHTTDTFFYSQADRERVRVTVFISNCGIANKESQISHVKPEWIESKKPKGSFFNSLETGHSIAPSSVSCKRGIEISSISVSCLILFFVSLCFVQLLWHCLLLLILGVKVGSCVFWVGIWWKSLDLFGFLAGIWCGLVLVCLISWFSVLGMFDSLLFHYPISVSWLLHFYWFSKFNAADFNPTEECNNCFCFPVIEIVCQNELESKFEYFVIPGI